MGSIPRGGRVWVTKIDVTKNKTKFTYRTRHRVNTFYLIITDRLIIGSVGQVDYLPQIAVLIGSCELLNEISVSWDRSAWSVPL